MEAVKLPTEIAQEPKEGAHLSQGKNSQPMDNKQRKITFAEATQSTENSCSQASSSYKEILSQPAPSLSHKQRLEWLQKRRAPGLWAQCDDCNRWRYLPHVLDAHELPVKWFCSMNPDKTEADCSIPEKPIRLREEEDLIHGEYSAGSVVWGRLAGWPWWPAMVDDCPDTEQFYWLDGLSDIPTYYNVVWFDGNEVTRTWLTPENLKPFASFRNFYGNISKRTKDKKRLEVALTQAEDAERLPPAQRLAKYSFIARYRGTINHPKKITKAEVKRQQRKLQRKYDIDFPESESSEDEMVELLRKRQTSTTVIRKAKNVLLVGSPNKKAKLNNPEKTKSKKKWQDSLLVPDGDNETATECNTEMMKEAFKEPNSMAVQIGSTVTSTVADATLVTDTPTTYVPESESENENIQEIEDNFQLRSTSPKSDDFDF